MHLRTRPIEHLNEVSARRKLPVKTVVLGTRVTVIGTLIVGGGNEKATLALKEARLVQKVKFKTDRSVQNVKNDPLLNPVLLTLQLRNIHSLPLQELW